MLRKLFLYEIESICVAFLPIIWLNRYYIYLKGENAMEHHTSVLSLMVVVAIAFFVPLLLQRFKLKALPVVVAEIIAGIFVGKSGFNIIEPDMWLQVLSTLGFIFLMFLSGLEIDFSIFKQKGKKNTTNEPNTFQAASIIFLFIFILSYALSLLFVWLGFVDNAMFMTLIISTISLGVVVPTLKENNLGKTDNRPNHFISRCYCRFSYNDFTRCICRIKFRKRSKHVAPSSSIRRWYCYLLRCKTL